MECRNVEVKHATSEKRKLLKIVSKYNYENFKDYLFLIS